MMSITFIAKNTSLYLSNTFTLSVFWFKVYSNISGVRDGVFIILEHNGGALINTLCSDCIMVFNGSIGSL